MKLDEKTKARAIDRLKILDGLPPHDGGSNFCRGDGYYANSIERDFGMSLGELRKATGYDKVVKKINKLLKQAAAIR